MTGPLSLEIILSELDENAEAVLKELIAVNPQLKKKEIYPFKVRLIPSLKGIASDTNPDNADAFVVHSVNEVYEFLRER